MGRPFLRRASTLPPGRERDSALRREASCESAVRTGRHWREYGSDRGSPSRISAATLAPPNALSLVIPSVLPSRSLSTAPPSVPQVTLLDRWRAALRCGRLKHSHHSQGTLKWHKVPSSRSTTPRASASSSPTMAARTSTHTLGDPGLGLSLVAGEPARRVHRDAGQEGPAGLADSPALEKWRLQLLLAARSSAPSVLSR